MGCVCSVPALLALHKWHLCSEVQCPTALANRCVCVAKAVQWPAADAQERVRQQGSITSPGQRRLVLCGPEVSGYLGC